MAAFLEGLATAFDSVIQATLQATVLAALILVLQRLLRKRLAPRWHYALWLLVLLRLFLPWTPESPTSVFNYVRTEQAAPGQLLLVSPDAEFMQFDPSIELSTVPPLADYLAEAEIVEPTTRLTWTDWLRLVWLGVAGLLFVYVCAVNGSLWWRVRREPAIDAGPAAAEYADCRRAMGIRASIRLIRTRHVSTPALLGLLRPRLLLPETMERALSREELRHVFLHELAHYRRGDLLVNWLMVACNIVHWFNPALWYAFQRMRADRELACDALAMSYIAPDETSSYGRTLLRLLEHVARPRPLPGLVGVMERRSHLKKRIRGIAGFKPGSYRWSILAVALIAVLSAVALTNASTQETAEEPLDSNVPDTNGDAAENATASRVEAGNDASDSESKDTEKWPEPPVVVRLGEGGTITADFAKLDTDNLILELGGTIIVNKDAGPDMRVTDGTARLDLTEPRKGALSDVQGETVEVFQELPPDAPEETEKVYVVLGSGRRVLIQHTDGAFMANSMILDAETNEMTLTGYVQFNSYGARNGVADKVMFNYVTGETQMEGIRIEEMDSSRSESGESPANVDKRENMQVTQPSNPEVLAKLESPVSLEFEDERLFKIAEFISTYAGVPIVVDNEVVAPVGETPSENSPYVTDGVVPYVKLKDVPLNDALKSILRPLNLAYEVRGDTLFISTAERLRLEDATADLDELAQFNEITVTARLKEGTTLKAAAEKLAELAEVNIVVDLREADSTDGAQSSPAEWPIGQVVAEDASLLNVLREILDPLGLAFAVQPGFIWISTPDRIATESFEKWARFRREIRRLQAELRQLATIDAKDEEELPDSPANAEKQSGTQGSPQPSPEVLAKLESPVSLEFEDERLFKIAEFISTYAGVPIVVDNEVVAPMGETAPDDSPYVTDGVVPYVKLDNVPLKDALKAILRPLKLTYEVRGDTVYISTPARLRGPETEGEHRDIEIAFDQTMTNASTTERVSSRDTTETEVLNTAWNAFSIEFQSYELAQSNLARVVKNWPKLMPGVEVLYGDPRVLVVPTSIDSPHDAIGNMAAVDLGSRITRTTFGSAATHALSTPGGITLPGFDLRGYLGHAPDFRREVFTPKLREVNGVSPRHSSADANVGDHAIRILPGLASNPDGTLTIELLWVSQPDEPDSEQHAAFARYPAKPGQWTAMTFPNSGRQHYLVFARVTEGTAAFDAATKFASPAQNSIDTTSDEPASSDNQQTSARPLSDLGASRGIKATPSANASPESSQQSEPEFAREYLLEFTSYRMSSRAFWRLRKDWEASGNGIHMAEHDAESRAYDLPSPASFNPQRALANVQCESLGTRSIAVTSIPSDKKEYGLHLLGFFFKTKYVLEGDTNDREKRGADRPSFTMPVEPKEPEEHVSVYPEIIELDGGRLNVSLASLPSDADISTASVEDERFFFVRFESRLGEWKSVAFRIDTSDYIVSFARATEGSDGVQANQTASNGIPATEAAYTAFAENVTYPSQIDTTHDNRIQTACDALLSDKEGAIVVLNADTGAVLAMAGSAADAAGGALNPAYQEAVPPGSLFKVVLAIAALEEGIITEETIYGCSGLFHLPGVRRPWKCWRLKYGGHGGVNVVDALAYSCDVFFYNVARDLGPEKIREWSTKLGLGVPTGIDFPGEAIGLIPDPAWKMETAAEAGKTGSSDLEWSDVETINMSIGPNGVLSTTLQNTVLMAAILNDGRRVCPFANLEGEPLHSGALVSEETLRIVQAGMRKCVERDKPAPTGTGKLAKIEGFAILGKTGEGQVVSEADTRRYQKDDEIPYEFRDHALFIAGVMDRSPRIAVGVLIKHGLHGSSAAAPVARAVIEEFYRGDV